MFGLFKCKHPADELHVQKDATVGSVDSQGTQHITYHLYCRSCGEKIDIKYAKIHEDVLFKNIHLYKQEQVDKKLDLHDSENQVRRNNHLKERVIPDKLMDELIEAYVEEA